MLLATLRIWLCKYILKSDKMYFVEKVGISNAPVGSLCMLEDIDGTLPFLLIKTESGWRTLTTVELKTEAVKIIQDSQREAGLTEEKIAEFWGKVRADAEARGMATIPHLHRPSDTETQ